MARQRQAAGFVALMAFLAAVGSGRPAVAQTSATIDLRGHPQVLRVYGRPGNPPVVVSSGDGGWVHLGPHVAEALAARGYFVVGFDVKAYLSGFTTRTGTLQPADVPQDYRVLAEWAARGLSERPVLIGVSEGAGLSLMAATERETRDRVMGVVALGLPDINELGWRWKDVLIYVTHRAPNEPSFSAAAAAPRVAPAPLAAIHSTRDEFVPLAEVQRILAAAREPKQLWIVSAANHRFSDNLAGFDARLLEALAWVKQNSPPR